MSEPIQTAPPVVLTGADVAKMLAISESHFHAMKQQGKFGPEPRKLGGSVRYLREEVVEWLKAGCPDRQTWSKGRARG